MDPITHAAVGIASAVAATRGRGRLRYAALAGLAGGLLPDADVFLKSATDPLFSIEYHRHFTHSLLLSPAVGLLGAGIAWLLLRLARRRTAVLGLWLPAWVAVLSHVFCDLWTSYGTRVWWPFADTRAALHWVSVVDPLLTLPLLTAVIWGLVKTRVRPISLGLGWVTLYLILAIGQQQRAQQVLNDWVVSRQGEPRAWRATVKPSFGNLLIWRALAVEGATLHVFAIRCGLGRPTVIPGATTPLFAEAATAAAHFGLPASSPQTDAIRRFFHFSDRWVGLHPEDPQILADLRYAALPHEIAPMWGIRIKPEAPASSIDWVQAVQLKDRPWATLWQMLLGRAPVADQKAQEPQ
jgi:inner membrane protein